MILPGSGSVDERPKMAHNLTYHSENTPETDTVPPDLLRVVLDCATGFIGIMTPDGILTDVNGPAMQTSGVARGDVIGKPLWDCDWWNFDPEVQKRLRAAVARAAKGEQTRYETEMRIAGDKRIVIDFLLTPHRDPAGKVDFLIPSGIDLTERVRTEKLLRAANESLQYLVTTSPFGVYVVDADFRFALVSAGAQKAFLNIEPLIGRDFAEIVRVIWPEPFASEVIGRFRDTLATGKPFRAQSTEEQRKDKPDVESYDWKIERAMLPDGRQGVFCRFHDLSEREAHSKELRAGEARFRATFDNAAVGIAHTASDGRWTLVNRKLCTILGYSEAEFLGMTVQDITLGADFGNDLELLDQLRSGAIAGYQIEKRYVTKTGATVWVNLSVSSMRRSDGTLDYCIQIVEDISQKKTAERQQRLLIAEINHRVKNILSTVQAMASQTMRTARNLAAFRETFTGRLRAISAAHDSVFQKGDTQADLADVIRNQLAPYAASGQDRLSLAGPSVQMNAACAHAFGLIIHELTTNATKYGALATNTGHISVIWQPYTVEGTRFVRLTWAESGGPPVKRPAKTGFGSRLITSTLEHSMRGSSRLEYRPEGLTAEFTFEVVELENA